MLTLKLIAGGIALAIIVVGLITLICSLGDFGDE